MRAFRIAPYPADEKNPYLDLFYNALRSYSIERSYGFEFSPRWIWQQGRTTHAVHFHWAEWLWNGRYEAPAKSLLKLIAFVLAARVRGVKVIWTVHNLENHEGGGRVDQIARAVLARSANLSILHSEAAANIYEHRYRPRGKVVVMPHGTYDGHYPEPRPRKTVLSDIGLEEGLPVLCCLGRLRDYKGLDLACEAFARIGSGVQMVIAGAPHEGFDMAPLERHAKAYPKLALVARALDDQEFVDILSVADVALLPYRKITGSGALLAAWSQGCGVVASDLDYFREVIPNESDAGRLFESGNVEELVAAIQEYLEVPRQRRIEAARRMSRRYAWEHCVQSVGEVLAGWRTSHHHSCSVHPR